MGVDLYAVDKENCAANRPSKIPRQADGTRPRRDRIAAVPFVSPHAARFTTSGIVAISRQSLMIFSSVAVKRTRQRPDIVDSKNWPVTTSGGAATPLTSPTPMGVMVILAFAPTGAIRNPAFITSGSAAMGERDLRPLRTGDNWRGRIEIALDYRIIFRPVVNLGENAGGLASPYHDDVRLCRGG